MFWILNGANPRGYPRWCNPKIVGTSVKNNTRWGTDRRGWNRWRDRDDQSVRPWIQGVSRCSMGVVEGRDSAPFVGDPPRISTRASCDAPGIFELRIDGLCAESTKIRDEICLLILLGEQGGRRGQNARRDKTECSAPQETRVKMTVAFHREIFLEEYFGLGFY